ncbi:MAG: V-type ATP synthase subunit D [archaeon]
MSSQAIRIRPTKVEFIKLRRRHSVAKRVHRIVKDRLTILVSELLSLSKDAMAMRTELNKELQLGYQQLMLTYVEKGGIQLAIDAMAAQRDVGVSFLTQNIAGVATPLIESEPMVRSPGGRGLTLHDEKMSLRKTAEHFERATELLVELAEIENSIVLVGLEVRVTRRKVGILEHSVIPRIEEMISYLSMKFEEREREEKTRLKRIKNIITRGRRI